MEGRHIDNTFAALIESINQPYLEYVKLYTELEDKKKLEPNFQYVELERELKYKKIEILTIVNFLAKYSHYYSKISLYIISYRHNSVFFYGVYPTWKSFEIATGIESDTIHRTMKMTSKNGMQDNRGYISKIKVKDFVDRWFLKIKY